MIAIRKVSFSCSRIWSDELAAHGLHGSSLHHSRMSVTDILLLLCRFLEYKAFWNTTKRDPAELVKRHIPLYCVHFAYAPTYWNPKRRIFSALKLQSDKRFSSNIFNQKSLCAFASVDEL